MDFVIDIQFFKGNGNVSIPKEIAIVSLDKDCIAHWLISSSGPIENLSRDIRKQNNWLTLHHHGIDYLDGEVSKRNAIKSLKDISKHARKIYVRGKEKWDFMNKETAGVIINLECDSDCPSFNNLQWNEKFCIYHALKGPTRFSCALNNAFGLKFWLNQNKDSSHTELESTLNNLSESWFGEFDPCLLAKTTSYRPEEEELKHEQPGAAGSSRMDSSSLGWCVPSRSDSEGVDETDSIYF